MRTKRKGTSKAIRRRRQRRMTIGIVAAVLVAGSIFGVQYVAHMSFWRIDLVEVKGADQVSGQDVRDHIEEEIRGSYWWLIPRDGIFFYPKDMLVAGLLEAFPRLEKVTITEDGFSVMEVYVTEREPYALWCKGDHLVAEDATSSCYFIDRAGYVFSEAPEFSGNVYLELLDSSTSTSHRLGIGTRYRKISLERVSPFLDKLSNLGLDLYAITAVHDQTVKILLDDGRYLLIDQSDDLEQVFENLRLVLDDQEVDITIDDPHSFSYIDLRFGKRIFFKPLVDESESAD